MRSVVRLRTRPGRPLWQLTTRPSTAAVLALVSLAAAGVQVVLFSSPPPWYQVAVVAFWVVVGLVFLVSAARTRARARRRAATPARPPVDSVPFVPVPVRPARPRRREEPDAAAEVGESTDPVAAVPTTTVRPRPGRPRPAPVGERTAVSRDRIVAAPRPEPSWRPSRAAEERTTTVAVTSRHAVRAVALAETAARSTETPVAGRRGAARPAVTAETVAIRDGRVRPRPAAPGRPAEGARTTTPGTTGITATTATATADTARRGGGRRRLADESRAVTPARPAGAAPADAVPSPRPAPGEERPGPAAVRAAAAPRPTPGRRAEETHAEEATVRRSSHARRTAAQEREHAPRERHTTQDRGPSRLPDVPLATPGIERTGATRRREAPPGSTETTAPFGGGLTFGGRVVPAEPAPESWAPAPRGPVPEPSTGRHAALSAPEAETASRRAARHAVAAEPGRRRAG